MTDLTDYKQVALEGATIINADCREVMASMPADSVDAIVCDPPYGLEFMGKEWDRPWAVSPTSSVGYEGREENLTLPTHRDNRNANCQTCGGRQRGKKRCTCDIPNWDRHPAEDMLALQHWFTEIAGQALRVLKPGGHLLAFGGTRTYHRITVAIEDAGFEIRDCLSWMYGSGFPKSMDVSKAIDKAAGAVRERGPEDPARTGRLVNQGGDYVTDAGWSAGNRTTTIDPPATDEAAQWDGWGTALKPSWEPIIMARKPFKGTVANNVLEHGTGAINIAATRIGLQPEEDVEKLNARSGGKRGFADQYVGGDPASMPLPPGADLSKGRWPANTLLSHDDECAEDKCVEGCPIAMLDVQSGVLKSGGVPPRRPVSDTRHAFGTYGEQDAPTGISGNSGGASRFFYSAKVSKKERNAGLPGGKVNDHPTVKPVNVMRWLVKMVTPPGGTVLDPFMGSGSTGIAALEEGFTFVGIDLESAYCNIAYHRLTHTIEKP